MKKWLPLIIIVILVFSGYRMVVGFNNNAVKLNEEINQSWGNVETTYQRRIDLIGNLVNTVQGAAEFEKSTLTEVINARAKATSMNIDISNATPQQLAEFNKVQGGLSGALKSLLVTIERYPDLKTNQNFLKLQDELASTENQVLTARTRFNEATKPYNNHVKTFPNKIFAGWFGFSEKPYFESTEGADKPVDVKFDFNKKE